MVINKGGDWISGICNYGVVFYDNTLLLIHNMGYHGVAVPGIPAQLLIPYDGPYGTQLPGVPIDTLWHHFAITTKDGESLVFFYLDGLLLPTFFDGNSIEVDLNPIDSNPLNIGITTQ